MRWIALPLLAAAVAGCGGEETAAQGAQDGLPSVNCDQIILQAKSGTRSGYRVILGGAVSIPPARLQRAAVTGERSWPYWTKAGLVLRGGHGPVEVSVAPAWRDRAAIGWGNPARPHAGVRFDVCPGHAWNAYAGGFFVKGRTACVPVTFRVAGRTATRHFALGRHRCRQP